MAILTSEQIQQILPHRFPFLLVDRITEMDEGIRAVGIKNVTVNEPFFQGHFPGRPIMPGVLIVEAMSQVGAVLILSDPKHKGKLAVFTGMDGIRFRGQVTPGDTLVMEATLAAFKMGMGKADVKATVDGKVVAGGQIMFALV